MDWLSALYVVPLRLRWPVSSLEPPALRNSLKPLRASPPPTARFMPTEPKLLVGPASIEPKMTIEMGEGPDSSSASSAMDVQGQAAAKTIARPARPDLLHPYAT